MHHKVQCYDIHWEYTILWLKQTTLGINTYMIICKFCDKECKSLNSKAQHELYCKLNPDAKIKKASMGMLGKSGSNQFIKGTAKPMSEEGREVIRQMNKERIWTTELRKKHSDSMKRAVENNPEAYSSSNRGRVKQIIYKGIKFQGNWELDFYKWCETNNVPCTRNIEGFKYEWNGNRTYFPDFYLTDKDVYIEVKGYKTERDSAKWEQFPKQLIVVQKQDIIRIKQNAYILPL